MRILITGSSGFIGKNFIELLNKSNHDILAMYNKHKPRISKKRSKVYFIKHDLNKKKINKKIISFKPDIIYHFAWQGIPNFDYKTSLQNLKSSYIFLKQIVNVCNIKKIIVSGSCFEYYQIIHGEKYEKYRYFIHAKKNLYSLLKQTCDKKNISLGWFRIFFVYGKNQRKKSLIPYIIESMKLNKKPKILTLSDKNDYIHINDVCNFFQMIIIKKFDTGIYDLGSGKLTSVKQIIQIIIDKFKFNKNDFILKIQKNSKKPKNTFIKADIKKLYKKFGWKIKNDIYKGLNITINDYN
tara:strand:- start:1233 stop:2120 length:888 start_codon:yes stop_codon:yes gene_type:complete